VLLTTFDIYKFYTHNGDDIPLKKRIKVQPASVKVRFHLFPEQPELTRDVTVGSGAMYN